MNDGDRPAPRSRTETRRLSFATGDSDAACGQVSSVFAPYRMHLASGRRLDFRLETVTSPRLTIGRMRYGVATVNEGPPMERCYHLVLPMAGDNTVEQNGARRRIIGGRSGFVLDPAQALQVSWSADSWQRHVKVPTTVIQAYAARLRGSASAEPVRFDLDFDLRTPAATALVNMVEYLDRELGRTGGVGSNPLAGRELEGALVFQLLMAVPNELSRALNSTERPPRSRIEEVIDYIDAHLDEEITAAALTAIAGVGIRTLQKGFHAATGMSPLAYVRNARLDRVRAELVGGAHSVTDAAARWGFYHPGRFAQQYRERFDELPSQTAKNAGAPLVQ